jgi:hypothetical protein
MLKLDVCMYFELFLYLNKVILVTYLTSVGLREMSGRFTG